MIKRKLLCIKKITNLSDLEKLLYSPYKNKVKNLVNLAADPKAQEFDPIAIIYDGLSSIPRELKPEYEALLGVTSYYQASKGGKGKLIEKMLAAIKEPCVVDLRLKDLPMWLEELSIYRKFKIYGEEFKAKSRWLPTLQASFWSLFSV
ncbi:MAG: hypothetical protein ACUVTD_08605, partial [Nitrososphaerales archaeon]